MIEDIEFGKFLPTEAVKAIIGKHLSDEDIHTIDGNRKATEDARKFYEEILPIMAYAISNHANEIMFVDDKKTDNSFDGKIKLTNDDIISIECTNAILKDDAIQQKILDRECNKRGFVELPFQSIEVSIFRKKIADIIKQAIQNKIEKSKKTPDIGKYKDFHLIVTLTASDFKWCNPIDIEQAIEHFIKPLEISPFEKVIFYGNCETGFPKYLGKISCL